MAIYGIPPNNWWLPPQKQYLSTTKRWYCDDCGKRTLIERNPDWDGSFRGEGKHPEWFVRCAVCKEKHWQSSGFECPNCGWRWPDEETIVDSTEPVPCLWASMEYGGNPVSWEETHQCPKCRKKFTITNANY